MSRTKQQFAAALTLAAVFATPTARAEPASAPFGDCRLGYWSSNRNLDDSGGVNKGTCFVNWKHAFGEQIRINVGGRLGTHDTADATGSTGRLREAYVEADLGRARFRLGRQIIAWGRADRINPTDNLSPRDFTALVSEDEEQRIGIDAVAGNFRLSENLDFVAVVVPKFEPHKLPVGSLPPNRVLRQVPDDKEWAVKLEKSGGSWDGSVSYYDGYDRYRRYSATFPSPSAFVLAGVYQRMRTVGLDFSTSINGWGLRSEFGASRFDQTCNCQADSRSEQRMVIGVDRDIGESANINAQIFGIHRSDYGEVRTMPARLQMVGLAVNRLNSEYDNHEYGITLRISDRYWNDRLKSEVSAIFDVSSHSGLVRPRLSYSVSDAVKVMVGGDYFYGEEQSFFGSRQRNRLGFVELVYVF